MLGIHIPKPKNLIPKTLTTLNNFLQVDLCKFNPFTNNYTMQEVEDIIQDEINNMEQLQDSTLFLLDIQRVNPTYDFVRAKAISLMVKSVEFTPDSYSYERVTVGLSYENIIDEIQQGGVTISFREFKEGYTLDFLTMQDEKPIIPTDGTVLLPYDYLFKIKLSVVTVKGNTRGFRELFNNFYYLDGSPTVPFAREESGEYQELQANFIPIMGY